MIPDCHAKLPGEIFAVCMGKIFDLIFIAYCLLPIGITIIGLWIEIPAASGFWGC